MLSQSFMFYFVHISVLVGSTMVVALGDWPLHTSRSHLLNPVHLAGRMKCLSILLSGQIPAKKKQQKKNTSTFIS